MGSSKNQVAYFVYVAHCEDGSLYTGITTDVKRRFQEHQNKKGGGYTRGHAVKKIVYTEPAVNRSSALKREAEIKSWRRAKKITELNLKLRK